MEASSTDDLTYKEVLAQLLDEQKQHRAEVAEMRAELQKSRTGAPAQSGSVYIPSAEELAAARQAEVDQHEFYCPGCGKLVDYRQQCHGRPEAPHQAIEVVPTAELSGPPEGHTPAPSTEFLG